MLAILSSDAIDCTGLYCYSGWFFRRVTRRAESLIIVDLNWKVSSAFMSGLENREGW